MDGVRGLSNWRWIFIIEGILSILIGIAAYFLVVNFPKEANWLTAEERKYVLAKTNSDETHLEKITSADVIKFFKDIKNILGAIMYFCKSNNSQVKLSANTLSAIVVPIYGKRMISGSRSISNFRCSIRLLYTYDCEDARVLGCSNSTALRSSIRCSVRTLLGDSICLG